MPSTTDSATTRDGIRLLTRHWEAGSPRAAVLLVHGLGEHSGRWEEVGAQLAAAGLEAFAWDHRGFGASGGERAWVDPFSQYHDDVQDRLAAVRAAAPGLPVVLYGHSMGGLIALGYALSNRPRPDLLVLSAPGIDDNAAGWKHALAPVISRIAPHMRIANGIPDSMLSRDPARQQAAHDDPQMLRASTARFGARFFEEQARVRAAASGLDVPSIVIHPTRASATSSTTSLRGRPCFTTSSPGSTGSCPPAAPRRPGRPRLPRSGCKIRRQLKIASGERSSAESVAQPQTRRT
ncbi:MAG: Alpha/beta hydrolase [Chloroflexi bacterium]|nr:Alpha/beta hydrolase [Chloroflexota bacterium]